MSVLNKLVFSPFEWSMSDRVSASPMEFVVRLDCIGMVDAAKLTEAILTEIKRQPLLQANTTVGETHLKSHWRPALNCTPEIRWCEGNPHQGSGFPKDFAPINLENEIGFRFYGWRFLVDEQDHIVMKFVYHHACCDGKAGIEFVENTFHRYQSLLDEKAASHGELAVIAERQILNRNLPTANKLNPTDRIWRAFVIRPKRVGNMLLSKPRVFSAAPAVGNGVGNDIFADPPRQCSTELSVNETKQLGALAKKLSASSNTLLARELFHTLNDHLESNVNRVNNNDRRTLDAAATHSHRALRILIPFSLRDERHSEMPVANCVSMAYLEATKKILRADSSSDPVLVSDLARQVDFIRRWNLQYSWIESIESYAKIWPIIRFLKFRRTGRRTKMAPIATTVMSNLGRVFRGSHLVSSEGELTVKSLVVKSVHLALPCSATVSIGFSVNFYGNRLTLDITYLPSLLSRETAADLLDSWKRRILDSVAEMQLDD